jgi:hypothetical protein
MATTFGESAWNPDEIQTGKGHRFACTDYSGGKVFIVNAQGKAEWEYETGHVNELWVLPNGNLLFNTGTGVLEVNRKKETVFEYKSEGEVYACQRLPNGNTFIGESTSGNLLEVDPSGDVVKKIPTLFEGQKGNHGYMRNVRKLANGNYLVAHYNDKVVKEYDPNGKVIREIPSAGGPHSVIRLPNGNTLIASGDKSAENKIMEIDPDGTIVWKLDQDELPGITLFFMTGLQRLPNGNTVITNWLGHGKAGKAPHIIEVTRDKKVVWTFQDFETMQTVSNIQLLDVPGDAIKGEILH